MFPEGLHRRARRRTGEDPAGGRLPGRLPYPHHPGHGRQGPVRAVPGGLQGDPRPAHRSPPGEGRGVPVSSRRGRSRTPPAASARCSPATPGKPAWTTTCRPTACGTSCSPDSRPTASTTLSSSPTAATPAEPRWSSTPRSPSALLRTPTRASSTSSPCSQGHLNYSSITSPLMSSSLTAPYWIKAAPLAAPRPARPRRPGQAAAGG